MSNTMYVAIADATVPDEYAPTGLFEVFAGTTRCAPESEIVRDYPWLFGLESPHTKSKGGVHAD